MKFVVSYHYRPQKKVYLNCFLKITEYYVIMSDFSMPSVRVSPCYFKEITPASNINITKLLYLLKRYERVTWL